MGPLSIMLPQLAPAPFSASHPIVPVDGEDENAPPGTTLNGARVRMGSRAPLSLGDIIGIGATTLVFAL